MPRLPRVTSGPDRFPASGPPLPPAGRGRGAVAAYLRAHLYGAAVGRTILDKCISCVGPADRVRLEPLRAQFDEEIATARRLLAAITPLGTPGRGMLRLYSTVALAALPAGPVIREPMTRLGLLETLRTLVVAKRSMWELLAASSVPESVATGRAGPVRRARQDADPDDTDADPDLLRGRLRGLADQARAQETLLEELRLGYGTAVFG